LSESTPITFAKAVARPLAIDARNSKRRVKAQYEYVVAREFAGGAGYFVTRREG